MAKTNPMDIINPVSMGLSAATGLAGAIGGKGGDEQPTQRIDPHAQRALAAGVNANIADLGQISAAPSAPVMAEYQRSQQALAAMQAPQPTITDPNKTAQDIAAASVLANAPTTAARERAYTEQAGAFGPTAAAAQTRAGETTQEKNLIAQMLAQLMPQLQEAKFGQSLQSFAQALGLESARRQTVSEPFDLINRVRSGLSGQLLAAGSPAAAVSTAPTIPAWSSGLTNLSTAIGRVPAQDELIRMLREKKGKA